MVAVLSSPQPSNMPSPNMNPKACAKAQLETQTRLMRLVKGGGAGKDVLRPYVGLNTLSCSRGSELRQRLPNCNELEAKAVNAHLIPRSAKPRTDWTVKIEHRDRKMTRNVVPRVQFLSYFAYNSIFDL